MFILNSSSLNTLLVLFFVAIIGVGYATVFHYWKWKGFPYLEISRMVSKIGNVYIGSAAKDVYDTIKTRRWKHAGLYSFLYPTYMPVSPDILKEIFQQDFDSFTEKGLYYNEKDDVLSANLFTIGGENWKFIRAKISPSFTIGKVKLLFNTILYISYQMQVAIDKLCQTGEILELQEVSERYTIDIIGSCVYGLKCNSLKDPDSEFRAQGKQIFKASLIRIVTLSWANLIPQLARFLRIPLFTYETRNFFFTLMKNVVKYRMDNGIIRKDVLQSLMELLEKQEDDNGLTIEQISAQAFVCFAAGFGSSASTISFCVYELSLNPNIQENARQEIAKILERQDSILNYDIVMQMKYLDQIIEETLRKYPPLAFLTRVCTKNYKILGTELTLDKGTRIVISVLGLHRDAEYFPDPEKFDPERFSHKNKQNIKPFTYMPFGAGPRICIGLKFGFLQVKVALISLLTRYKFSVNEKTEQPLMMDPMSYTMTTKNGIYLNVEKLTNQIELRGDQATTQ